MATPLMLLNAVAAEAKLEPAAVQQPALPPAVSSSAQQPVQAVGTQSGQLRHQASAPSGPVQSAQQGHVQAQRAHQPPAQFQPQAFPQGLAQSLLLPGATQLPQMYQQVGDLPGCQTLLASLCPANGMMERLGHTCDHELVPPDNVFVLLIHT